MPKAIQISNWDRFEKSDNRKCTTMKWVGVPIDHNGLGYLEIMSHPEGVGIIGGWLLILQLAAQCPKRGLLVADSGRIFGAREIALKTRAPEKHISVCIAMLLEIGWIEEVDVSGKYPETIPTVSRPQDRTVQDKTSTAAAAVRVDTSREEAPEDTAAAASENPFSKDPDVQAAMTHAKPQPRQLNAQDFKSMFPVMHLPAADMAHLDQIILLFGQTYVRKAIDAAKVEMKPPKIKVFMSDVTRWLEAHVELDESDYQRAGLPMPGKV